MAEHGLADFDLESIDPSPDVHALFAHYNDLYFDNQLGACSVEWSTKRMTLCAGVCHFSRTGGCRIKLSEPLLKFRPVRDLKDTLLHEMIHAVLFLGNVRDDGDHGPKFRAVMTRINNATCTDPQRPPGGYNITVYHTMHDEVNNYRTHVWRCTTCGNLVRRAMNRPPQEADCRAYSKAAAAAAPGGGYCRDPRCWYHGHVRTCGGVYEKIAEPEKPTAKAEAASGGGSSSTGSKPPAAAANKGRHAAGAAGAPPITHFFNKQGGQQQQGQRSSHAGSTAPQQQGQGNASVQAGTTHQHSSQQQGASTCVDPLQAAWPADPRAAAAAAALARAADGLGAFATTAAAGSCLRGSVPSLQQHQSQTACQPPPPQQQQQHASTQQRPLNQALPSPHHAQQQPAASQNPPTEFVDLLSTDEEDDSPSTQPGPPGPNRLPASGSRHSHTSPAVTSGSGRASGGWVAAASVPAALMCPVCCQEFEALAALNAHLDECLL